MNLPRWLLIALGALSVVVHAVLQIANPDNPQRRSTDLKIPTPPPAPPA